MSKCNYGNCEAESTVEGHIYGRYNSGSKCEFIPVSACEKHAKLDGFFWARDTNFEELKATE